MILRPTMHANVKPNHANVSLPYYHPDSLPTQKADPPFK